MEGQGSRLRVVSNQPVHEAMPVLEELARDQHARPVSDVKELRLDVWSSAQELDEFLGARVSNASSPSTNGAARER